MVEKDVCSSSPVRIPKFSQNSNSQNFRKLLQILTSKKRCPFHSRELECKSRKSRDTWNDRQIWPWGTKWSRANANRVLPREWTGLSKHPLQQHNRILYTWTSPDGQYQNQIDYILCSQRWRSSIQSAKIRLGADCGSDHEIFIAKFRLKLKKVGKTTRPFRYDINQIPYNYTVEVTNRFKRLDLIEFLKNYGWRFVTLYRRQWSRPSPPKKKMQKGKMVVWGGLNSWKKKRTERQRRKGKIYPSECRVPKNSKEK